MLTVIIAVKVINHNISLAFLNLKTARKARFSIFICLVFLGWRNLSNIITPWFPLLVLNEITSLFKWQEERRRQGNQITFQLPMLETCNLVDITSYCKPSCLLHVHLSNNRKVWRIFLYKFSQRTKLASAYGLSYEISIYCVFITFHSLYRTLEHTSKNKTDKFPTLIEFTILGIIHLKLLSACCI